MDKKQVVETGGKLGEIAHCTGKVSTEMDFGDQSNGQTEVRY